MESWEEVGGRKKTTKAAGQGLRPRPSVGRLGGPNREQSEQSGGEGPNNGATRHGSRGEASVQISVARARERPELRRPIGEREIPHFVGPQHGDLPPSYAETISSPEEKSGWDDIDPEAYERVLRNDPISMGCHKVVDPSAGYYKANKMCCGRPTTVRCPFCMLPLCDKHTGEYSNRGCDLKLQIANQREGRESAPFNPDTTRGENQVVGGARELPRRLMPAPAPLDSVLHYPTGDGPSGRRIGPTA